MKIKEQSYEAAMARLEALVKNLENGTQPLESLAEELKEAQALAAFCKAKLEKTEKEVEAGLLQHQD